MLTTWIEASARGRLGGPMRAGMWSAIVVGTHPIQADQEVWVELTLDEVELGRLPAYWIENRRNTDSLWHVPIPPMTVNSRLKYRAGACQADSPPVYSAYQEVVVRPNLPSRYETPFGAVTSPEGLVGNRMMTVRVDDRGATYDVYYPTVGLHSDVRPAAGDQPQSRAHFRGILGGLAIRDRFEWFSERSSWEAVQKYQGATNLLVTDLSWRHGPIRVVVTDLVAMGPNLPRTSGGAVSTGQYIKRFRIVNQGDRELESSFGLFVHAEVNGGIGDPGLSWQDSERTLVATNRGHGHGNRKLARDATVEFALALDDVGPIGCEAVGPNEAMLLRPLLLPPNSAVQVDVLVSGAFTGWRGDDGTYNHWLRPALDWFRTTDIDQIEQEAAHAWDDFVERMPATRFPRPDYSVSLRRSALAAALHTDAEWGAVVSGFERGLQAYCWPRDAVSTGAVFDRLGHPELGAKVYEWLGRVRGKYRPYAYWFQKYTVDGWPEWETPAVDQTALIPWGLERHYRRTGDKDLLAASWSMIEQAASVCAGRSGHPGLSWIEDLSLICSAGLWDNRYGAFLYSNACVVAGLRSAARIARILERPEPAEAWQALADRVWYRGVLAREGRGGETAGLGLIDQATGRYVEARRLSSHRGIWSDRPEGLIDRSWGLDVSLLAPAVPLGLVPADDPAVVATADLLLAHNPPARNPNTLSRWVTDPSHPDPRTAPGEAYQGEASSLATLWMARYLLQRGRATGEGAFWNRAISLIDDILNRLGPLGLALRMGGRKADEPASRSTAMPGVWGLHGMLIDAILDIAGLEPDVPEGRLQLDPVLPPAWNQVGISTNVWCGDVSYRLERPIGGTRHRLVVESRLDRPIRLDIAVTCPGLVVLGDWQARAASPTPPPEQAGPRISWSVDLSEGASEQEWSWG